MPAKSTAQYNAMQAAKHGDPRKLRGAARQIQKSMSPSDLEHFTGKKPKGLPRHVESAARKLIISRRFEEGRDDISKLHLEPESKSYARISSKDVMSQPGGTSNKWRKSVAVRKAITNQRNVKGFPSMDKAEDTSGKKLREARRAEVLVDRLLDASFCQIVP